MMKEKNPNVLLCTVPQRIGNRANSNSNNVNFPPPLAILSLFDWMDKFGYSGDFYDIHLLLPSNDEIYNHITSVAPDVVGLSAVVGQAYKQTKLISSIVRSASPDALIIVGGNMALSANVLLKKTDIDVCALGDGENTLIEIIKYRKKYGNSIITKELLKIKGIAFLNEDGEMEFTGWGVNNSNKDNQFPDYELLSKGLLDHPELIDHYFGDGKKNNLFQSNPKAYEPNRKPRMAHVTTSKGCVATCSFCKQLTKLRAFDLTPFEDHLIELKNKYDVQFVQVLDENFGGLKQHSLEVARILHKHDFLWKSGWRVNSFTLEEVKFLTECGWTDIDATIETFSSKILKIMDKRITVEEIRTAIKNYADCGVLSTLSPPHADMLIGNPGETDETIIESGRHLGKVACELDFPLPITDPRWVVTTPGTHMFAYAQLIGVVGTEVDDVEEFLLFISDKSASWEAFVNLTGESIKTVEFWPYLLQFACTRAYYDNMKKKMKNKGESVVKSNRNFITLFKSVKDYKFKLHHPRSYFEKMMKTLAKSYLFYLIPTTSVPYIYNILQNFNYFQVVFFNIIILSKKFPFFRIQWKIKDNYKLNNKCTIRIDEPEALRRINNKLMSEGPQQKTKSGRNQQIIYSGSRNLGY